MFVCSICHHVVERLNMVTTCSLFLQKTPQNRRVSSVACKLDLRVKPNRYNDADGAHNALLGRNSLGIRCGPALNSSIE